MEIFIIIFKDLVIPRTPKKNSSCLKIFLDTGKFYV